MKAYLLNKYGDISNLKWSEVEKPVPKEDEVLIKVKAAAVNDYDWCILRGKPLAYRLIFGLLKPKLKLGMELSGTIEAVGELVTKFKPGDQVFGDISNGKFGAFAEFCCTQEDGLSLKPPQMTFEVAAALSHAGNLASQGLIDIGKIKSRQKILINGAGGGVGCLALQLAKTFNVEVWGVDNSTKLNKMIELGFDRAIDYQIQDISKLDEQFDLVLDAKTSYAPWEYLSILTAEGKYISIGGRTSKLLQLVLFKGLLKLVLKKRIEMVNLKVNKDLKILTELVISEKLKPVIDGPFKLEDLPQALQRFGKGLHFGKVIVSLSNE